MSTVRASRLRTAIIAGAAAALLVVGVGVSMAITGEKLVANEGSSGLHPTNENGLTYGSAAIAPSPDAEPDLIAAIATNGREGYVMKSELDRRAENPEDAARVTAENLAGYTINVYAQDGVTVVGEFQVAGGFVLPPSKSPTG